MNESVLPLLIADIHEAAGHFRRIGEAIANEEGQTQARWQLMSVVSERPFTVAQASRRLGLARQGVQRIANELTEAGLTQFQENPDHKTSPMLSLTDQGAAVFERLTRRAAKLNKELGKWLSELDLERMDREMRSLIELIEAVE